MRLESLGSHSTTQISTSSLPFHSVPELRRSWDLKELSFFRRLEDFAPSQLSNLLNIRIAIIRQPNQTIRVRKNVSRLLYWKRIKSVSFSCLDLNVSEFGSVNVPLGPV